MREQGGALIVGCGRIAGGYNDSDTSEPLTHIVALRRAGMPVLAVVDREPGRARTFAERWNVATHTDDLAHAVSAVQPVLVSVCTHPDTHTAVIPLVTQAPSVRAVIIEKPLGRSADEAAMLSTHLTSWGGAVIVNYFRAFDPAYRFLAQAVRDKRWGAAREIVARYYGPAFTNASHLVERVVDMMGLPNRTYVTGGLAESPRFVLEFSDGITASFLSSAGMLYQPLELDILFERGRVRVLDGEQRAELFLSVPDPLYVGFHTLRADADGMPPPSHRSFARAIAAGVDAARGRELAVLTLSRAVSTTRIIESVVS